MRPTLVVSLHDVAPSTAWVARAWIEALRPRPVPVTLLVVPGPWEGPPLRDDPMLLAWLRDCVATGDEIAQHGWTHRGVNVGVPWRRALGRVVARGCAEFVGLDEREARRRLEFGREVLEAPGLHPIGFTPPGWLASPGTYAALTRLGYRYTTSPRAVHDLLSGTRIAAPALSHRPGAMTEPLAARVFESGAHRLVRNGRVVRVALHPADLATPGLVATTLRTIDAVLDAGGHARTYADLVTAHATARAA